MKKIFALALAALMTAGMTTVAFAAKDDVEVAIVKKNGTVVIDKNDDNLFDTTADDERDIADGNVIDFVAADGGHKVAFPLYNKDTGARITEKDDVKGLKLRVPESPSVVAVWEALGASPVQISVSELFTSLEGGIADGQDNNVLSMWANSYYEVQKYYMELEYIQNAQVLWISQSTWDKLTDEQQGWVSEAVERAHDENTADAQAEYAESKKNCEEGGMEFIEFDREAFVSSAEKLAREMEGDLFSAGLYDQIKALDEA